MEELMIILIGLLIVLVFVTPWIRSSRERRRPTGAGLPMPRSPRDISESGGYQSVSRAQREPPTRFPMAERAVEEEAPLALRRTAAVPIDSRHTERTGARLVRRALATPESLRTAILLKEILDSPISMKEHGQ